MANGLEWPVKISITYKWDLLILFLRVFTQPLKRGVNFSTDYFPGKIYNPRSITSDRDIAPGLIPGAPSGTGIFNFSK